MARGNRSEHNQARIVSLDAHRARKAKPSMMERVKTKLGLDEGSYNTDLDDQILLSTQANKHVCLTLLHETLLIKQKVVLVKFLKRRYSRGMKIVIQLFVESRLNNYATN